MQLRLEVDQNLYLLTLLIECITSGSILSAGILTERNVSSCGTFHIGSSLHQTDNVKTCHSYGKQTHRSEHAETSAHIVGNHERGVSLAVGSGTCSTLLGIGNSHNDLASHLYATLLLTLFLEQTECQSSLGGGTALAYIDDTEVASTQILGQLIQIVLTDVVTCE